MWLEVQNEPNYNEVERQCNAFPCILYTYKSRVRKRWGQGGEIARQSNTEYKEQRDEFKDMPDDIRRKVGEMYFIVNQELQASAWWPF